MTEFESILERLRRIESQIAALDGRLGAVEKAQHGEKVHPADAPAFSSAKVEAFSRLAARSADETTATSEIAASTAPPPEAARPQPVPAPVSEVPREAQAAPAATPPPQPAPPPKDFRILREEEVKPAFDWKDALRKVNLWPPEGEGNLEIQIGTWWVTRIGALFAVISAVFFGIYISRHSPVVRFFQLLGASVGVTVLGLWLERKLAQFGGVLFACGLALLYFTAFASYAVPAVHVIDSRSVAAVLQFAVVALIVACALWRNSEIVATMAAFLGYTACLFSFLAGMSDFALIAALTLGCGAVFLHAAKEWTTPQRIGIALSYIVYAAVLIHWTQHRQSAPSFGMCLAYILANMGIYGAADYASLLRKTLADTRPRRIAQIFNSSAAVALGFATTYVLFHSIDNLAIFYFLFGGVLLAGSAAYFAAKCPDALMQSYFIKGTALITMGLITKLEARTEWIALAAQCACLLFAARRSQLKSIEAAMSATWIVSLALFVHDMSNLRRATPEPTLWSTDGLAAIGYFLFSTGLFCLKDRWLTSGTRKTNAYASTNVLSSATAQDRLATGRTENAIYCALLAFVGALIVRTYFQAEFQPLAGACVAVAAIAVGLALRHWIGFAVGALVFGWAHTKLWSMRADPANMWKLWVNGGTLAMLTAAGAGALAYLDRPFLRRLRGETLDAADGALHALWMAALYVCFAKAFPYDQRILLATLTALAVAAISIPLSFRVLGDVSAFPILLALLNLMFPIGDLGRNLTPPESLWTLWAVFALAYGYACAYAAIRPLQDRLKRLPLQEAQALHTLLAAAVGLYALQMIFKGTDAMLALAIAAMPIAALSRWPGLRPAYFAAIAYVAWSGAQFAEIASEYLTKRELFGSERFLWTSIATGAAAIALASTSRFWRRDLSAGTHKAIQWVLGVMGLGLLYILFLRQRGDLRNYTTAFWGISAIAVFLAGFLLRAKPLRIVALAGLALCVPRMLLVDVRETLYRIAASGVLGLVLLAIGFLYYRFKDIIEKWDAGDAGEGQQQNMGKDI